MTWCACTLWGNSGVEIPRTPITPHIYKLYLLLIKCKRKTASGSHWLLCWEEKRARWEGREAATPGGKGADACLLPDQARVRAAIWGETEKDRGDRSGRRGWALSAFTARGTHWWLSDLGQKFFLPTKSLTSPSSSSPLTINTPLSQLPHLPPLTHTHPTL